MWMAVLGVLYMGVKMGVPDTVVFVRVNVEEAAPPSDDEPHRQVSDCHCDRAFGELLHALRQIPVEHEDRDAEREERRRMTESPGRPQGCGRAGRPLSRAGDEGRDCGDVVRIGRMPQTEQDGHEDDDPGPGTFGVRSDELVKAEHVNAPRRLALAQVRWEPSGRCPGLSAATKSGAK